MHGKNSTMSEFDWRSPKVYAQMEVAEIDDFAWEYLRRNSDYQGDYRALQRAGSLLTEGVKFRLRWGLSFRG
jgi:hypothetical protein